MAQIVVKGLSFGFTDADTQVLNNIDLEIEKGDFVLLCGESGCGKTTLLRHLKREIAPHGNMRGQILYNGKPLEEMDERKSASEIGFVMQNPDNQLVTDKVWHELAFGLENLGLETGVIRRRVAEMASYFGIHNWFNMNVHELSGGQKQMLNLAGVMVMQPKLLVLDEPTSQLDPNTAAEFLDTIYKINRELAVTVLMTEHRLEDVFSMADHIAIMREGRLICKDTPKGIVSAFSKSDGYRAMYEALPSASRIFCAVSGEQNAGDAPITVREGRRYLERNLPEKLPAAHSGKRKSMENEISVEIEDIWFRYEKNLDDVLKGVAMKASSGELFCILGGNGTGKSTTINVLSGVRKAQRGRIKLFGKKMENYPSAELYRDILGVLPQDPQTLFTGDSVIEDLADFAMECALENSDARIAEVVALMGIGGVLGRHPFDLSGGEQQKCAFAKVLLRDPKVIILDEPTKGLDAGYKKDFANILKELLVKGKTIIMATHDVEFAAEYADRCALFFDGYIVSEAESRSFFCGNSFYTTAANRISRGVMDDAVTCGEVIERCRAVQ